tara:strand:+ start:1507 stop:1710 length:204 start_codon:yes stop_codon:yes gene_type:complete
MNNLIDTLISEFKKQKIIRGNIFDNFLAFCYEVLGGRKDDKYKGTRASILKYISANKSQITLKLTRN